MPPTPSTRPPAEGSVNFQAAHRCWWVAAPLVFCVAATAGCQSDRKTNFYRLPPEKELQQYADETAQKTVDPRRMSHDELEVRDGVKALKDAEENGVKIKE